MAILHYASGFTSNGTYSDIEIGQAGGLQVTSGQTVVGTELVFDSAYLDTNSQPALLEIFPSGSASDTLIEDGTLILTGVQNFVLSGVGLATDTTLDGAGVAGSDPTFGYDDGSADLAVNEGGVAIGGSVLFGDVVVAAGGSVSNFTVTSGGIEATGSSAVVSATIVYAGGMQVVTNGANAFDTVVSSGGGEDVAQDATATSTTVWAGGSQVLGDAAHPIYAWGGSSLDTTIESGATQTIYFSGLALDTQVQAGGSVSVSDSGYGTGGIASNTNVMSGGSVTVFSGGIASGTVLSAYASQFVSSGGLAVATDIQSDASETVGPAGSASATLIEFGGTQNNSGFTFGIGVDGVANDYGVAKSGVINAGGVENDYGAASATTVVGGGILYVSGAAQGTVVNAGGTEIVGGVATGTTIFSGGKDQILSGGETMAPTISGGTLELQTNSIVSGAVDFGGSGGILQIDALSAPANVISGFAATDEIDFHAVTYAAAPPPVVNGDSVTVQLGASAITLDIAGASNDGEFFVTSATDGSAVLEAACYCRGVRIATDQGPVAVEHLAIGDRLITATGEAKPIKWIGRRRLDTRKHPDPKSVWPICVSAGAFGALKPARDLWLSPGHNIAVEGALMAIHLLQNNISIVQRHCAEVEYWHVELDRHNIIFAEGLAAESYLDNGNRAAFDNGGAFIEAHPDFKPRHWAQTCLPLVFEGPAVVETKARLIARLAETGHVLHQDADAHVLVDGLRIEPIRLSDTRIAFVLPPEGREIALKSRVFVPAHSVAESIDPRELGLCVGGLQIDGVSFGLDDDAACASGWHSVERVDGCFLHRWTTGSTPLPPSARIVVVDLAGVGHYWREPGDLDKAVSIDPVIQAS